MCSGHEGTKSIIEDRDLPAEVLPYRTAKKKNELRKMNNAVQNCLTAMFSNQIFNARKVCLLAISITHSICLSLSLFLSLSLLFYFTNFKVFLYPPF